MEFWHFGVRNDLRLAPFLRQQRAAHVPQNLARAPAVSLQLDQRSQGLLARPTATKGQTRSTERNAFEEPIVKVLHMFLG